MELDLDQVRTTMRFLRRATSVKDWDDNGAEPIKDSVWALALSETEDAMTGDDLWFPSTISPSADGTVMVIWLTETGCAQTLEVSEERGAEYFTQSSPTCPHCQTGGGLLN